MIYYTTVSLGFVEGHESQGINDAIAQGLAELNEEAGGPVILKDVIPMVIPADKPVVCITILAKPYEPERQGSLEDLLGKFVTLNEGRGIMEKIGEVL